MFCVHFWRLVGALGATVGDSVLQLGTEGPPKETKTDKGSHLRETGLQAGSLWDPFGHQKFRIVPLSEI